LYTVPYSDLAIVIRVAVVINYSWIRRIFLF